MVQKVCDFLLGVAGSDIPSQMASFSSLILKLDLHFALTDLEHGDLVIVVTVVVN